MQNTHWYRNWHDHPKHAHAHWGMFVAVALIAANFLIGQINIAYNNGEFAIIPTEAQAASSLLLTSDLTCAGVFRTPSLSTGVYTSSYPVAMRYVNGSRHYFMYGGNGDVIEFPEPTLSPCNTPLSSVNRAQKESWGGNWGKFNVNAGNDTIPYVNSSAVVMGLYYDVPTSQLMLSWTNTYSGSPPHNSFAGATLDNTNHKLVTAGCWGLSNIITPQSGSGLLNIPNSFVSSYLPSGARWGVGFGGAVASYAGISLGPTLFAIVPPSGNPCAPSTDNFVPSGTILARYGQNSSGPNCHNFRFSNWSGTGLGCTPTKAPTTPLHAKMSFTNYSTDMYAADWNPYQGTGWFNNSTVFSMGWYDDGVKQGVVVPFLNSEGWSKTTVSPSPAPTITSGLSGVMYVASTSTNDGNNMNPGDTIWIQTCVLNVDPNCSEGSNNRHLSFAVVDTVDPASGRVGFHLTSTDFSSSNHAPVAGGAVFFGCLYAHGSPTCSRGQYRLQIYDPAQYAQVIAGTRQSYDVTYNQEMDLHTFVKGFGCPSCGGGVEIGNEHHGPVSTIPDPQAHQIMIAFTDDGTSLYSISNAIYVFNVGPNAVTPPISPQPSPSPSPSPAPAPAPAPSPTPNPTPVSGFVTDAFTRGDANTLGTNWTTVYGGNANLNGGAQGIKTNKAYADGATLGHSAAYWSANSFNADQYSQAKIESTPLTNAFVAVRMSGASGAATGKGYEGYLDGRIMKMSPNGAYTQLAATVGGGTSGDILKLTITGNTLNLYRNGVKISTATDSTYTTGSPGIGWGWYSYTPTIDDWEGGNIVSVTPAPAPAPTPTPTPTPIVGDINNDGIVNSLDWSLMNAKWFTADATADLNKDGIVNSIDFSILNNNWLKTAP